MSPASALLAAKKKPVEEVDLLAIIEIVMHALPSEPNIQVHLCVAFRRGALEALQKFHALKICKVHGTYRGWRHNGRRHACSLRKKVEAAHGRCNACSRR